MENAARVGELGLGRLREMMDRHPLIGDVRGRGCLLGAELVLDREQPTPAADAADAVLYKALGPRPELQDHHGQRPDPDAAFDRHGGRRCAEAMEIIEESIGEVESELRGMAVREGGTGLLARECPVRFEAYTPKMLARIFAAGWKARLKRGKPGITLVDGRPRDLSHRPGGIAEDLARGTVYLSEGFVLRGEFAGARAVHPADP